MRMDCPMKVPTTIPQITRRCTADQSPGAHWFIFQELANIITKNALSTPSIKSWIVGKTPKRSTFGSRKVKFLKQSRSLKCKKMAGFLETWRRETGRFGWLGTLLSLSCTTSGEREWEKGWFGQHCKACKDGKKTKNQFVLEALLAQRIKCFTSNRCPWQ